MSFRSFFASASSLFRAASPSRPNFIVLGQAFTRFISHVLHNASAGDAREEEDTRGAVRETNVRYKRNKSRECESCRMRSEEDERESIAIAAVGSRLMQSQTNANPSCAATNENLKSVSLRFCSAQAALLGVNDTERSL